MHKFLKSTSRKSGQNNCQQIPKLTPFVPNVIMTALTKAVEKQDKKISAFLKSSHPHSLGEQVMKAHCRLCLLLNRCHVQGVSDFFIIIIIDFFKCDWACLLQRSLRNIRVHSGHGYRVIVIISGAEVTEVEEELQVPLEVFVEESIEYGVDTGGDHGREVAEQEQQVVVARGNDLMVPVKHSVKDGERQPADGEGHHDGEQHDVDPFGFTGPVLVVSHLVHHVVPPL